MYCYYFVADAENADSDSTYLATDVSAEGLNELYTGKYDAANETTKKCWMYLFTRIHVQTWSNYKKGIKGLGASESPVQNLHDLIKVSDEAIVVLVLEVYLTKWKEVICQSNCTSAPKKRGRAKGQDVLCEKINRYVKLVNDIQSFRESEDSNDWYQTVVDELTDNADLYEDQAVSSVQAQGAGPVSTEWNELTVLPADGWNGTMEAV